MAKLFYTVEEAAQKLGMSEDEIKALGESGQIQEFRDRDRLMFKKDQVDLLAGDDGDDDTDITLAESGELEPISLSSSGSGSAFSSGTNLGGSAAGDTGVSIFDPDETEAADANSDTLVSGSGLSPQELLDSGASGSGLAQLSLEPDDTSLGSDLLQDLSGDDAGESAVGAPAMAAGGAVFETSGGDSDFAAPAAAGPMPGMMAASHYDGPWSGLGAGLALGATVALLLGLAVMILGMSGAGSAALLEGITSTTVYIVAGGLFALTIIAAGVGYVLLRKS
ncbi:MAG: helix-turn-helix domain-containing protein [Planctomycetota bacterium]